MGFRRQSADKLRELPNKKISDNYLRRVACVKTWLQEKYRGFLVIKSKVNGEFCREEE